jgi:hypothetical protein
MNKTFTYIKEILFIFAAMLAPIVLWLGANLIGLITEGNTAQLGSASGEMIEGLITTTFILVAPATLLFWILLKLFRKHKSIAGKDKILLAIVAASAIVGTLFLFNLTNIPEWLAFVTVPVGVFVLVFLSNPDGGRDTF